MQKFALFSQRKYLFTGIVFFLLIFSTLILRAIAPFLFPNYFLYIALSLIVFVIFSGIDFEIFSLFSKHFYIGSILLLLLPIFIGQITRGAIRWINIGPLTLQPSEIVRPFLLVYFSNFLTEKDLDMKRLVKSIFLLAVPVFLILVQPSLGVSILTVVGFAGILLSTNLDKKYILFALTGVIFLVPVVWRILAPYQKARLMTFINPQSDPLGSGYNSLQSMIAVGSGKIWGRGLGKGVQTQLSFLPERHTDFIFASIAEELGFFGALFILSAVFVLLFKIAGFLNMAKSYSSRAYISGVFTILLIQGFIHIGMNMGILPITGITLPLVSAGGSSLLGTMMSLGIVLGAIKEN